MPPTLVYLFVLLAMFLLTNILASSHGFNLIIPNHITEKILSPLITLHSHPNSEDHHSTYHTSSTSSMDHFMINPSYRSDDLGFPLAVLHNSSASASHLAMGESDEVLRPIPARNDVLSPNTLPQTSPVPYATVTTGSGGLTHIPVVFATSSPHNPYPAELPHNRPRAHEYVPQRVPIFSIHS